MSLQKHLGDSGAIAGWLWDEMLPDAARRTISQGLPGGLADGRRVTCWLAGIHDIGKATPAFQVQVPSLAGAVRDGGLSMSAIYADRAQLKHGLAGHRLLADWLVREHSWSMAVAHTFAVVVGGHHGTPPGWGSIRAASLRPHLLGEGLWVEAQLALLDAAARRHDVLDRLSSWGDVPLTPMAQALISGVVIVADWLASDDSSFPLGDPTSAQQRAERAWRNLGLPRPWSPGPPPAPGQHIERRFRLPEGAVPHPVQQATIEAAGELTSPGLIILEAPMGTGKTEAALAAAEVLAYRFGAGGVFFALPTMATSDGMFRRVREWVEALPAEGLPGDRGLYLAHGRAGLNREYARLVRAGRLLGVGLDECRGDSPSGALGDRTLAPAMVAHQWLSGRKKGPLHTFVVGTIDQVLLMGLQARHLVLRHLALGMKVVVIDEVHAADRYMRQFLIRALEWLAAYDVPVIVLSATLPGEQRRELLAAYDSGRARAVGRRPRRAADPHYQACDGNIGYPSVTSTDGDTITVRLARHDAATTVVALERMDDDDRLVRLLSEVLVGGGCLGIVRNTVRRAQDTYDILLQHFPPEELLLLHSRFLSVDRQAREESLRARLGPASQVRDGTRPSRLIVIGTQVIEQSLDIDFDLLISDLAPMDLLLQRMGRLHRHRRGQGEADRPALLRAARCVLVGVEDWSTRPVRAVPGSRRVYGEAGLLRAASVLDGLWSGGGRLVLPDDIAPMVQDAYDPGHRAPAGWVDALRLADAAADDAAGRAGQKARAFMLGHVPEPGESLIGWLDQQVGEAGEDGPRGHARVRDTEDTLEVLVVQRVAGELRPLPWTTDHVGGGLSEDAEPPLALALTVVGCSLRLPAYLTVGERGYQLLNELELNYFVGWQTSHWLAGQLVLVLDEELTAHLAGWRLMYDPDRGLLIDDMKGGGE